MEDKTKDKLPPGKELEAIMSDEKKPITDDLESETPVKYSYPKSVGFIITNEFCERFSFYGMRTILALYLSEKLSYTEDDSIVIYHVFTMFVYFFPIFGAMIADSWLGRFKTIFYLSIVYALGNILLSLTAMPPLSIPLRPFTIIGLLLVAVGTGGIKPCVSAFGGDQFKLPQQEKQLATFFSLFYFAINAGSFISTFITPILRLDVHCFGDKDCYSLAFGVPGILMIVSIVVFILGRPLYVIKEPSGNVLLEVTKCTWHAITRRHKIKKEEKKDHWLDYADDKYSAVLIGDVKALLKVLLLFIPLPVFWALFDQQGSRWTFQATRMNGAIGDYMLKPDQMQVVNPLLILIFIPLFEVAIYPALKWCRIATKPLHKMVIGGLLAAVAFIVSAIVELQLQETYPVLPSAGLSQFRLYNGLQCDLTVNTMDTNFTIKALGYYENKYVPLTGNRSYPYNISEPKKCKQLSQNMEAGEFMLQEAKSISYFISNTLLTFEDNNDKTSKGNPAVRVLKYHGEEAEIRSTQIYIDNKLDVTIPKGNLSRFALSKPGKYDVKIGNTTIMKDQLFDIGGVYAIVMNMNSNITESEVKEILITPLNSIHMFWLLPQYIIITMAEVMFSVTGLEFSFTQAPASMKSVLTAGWLLTVAFGNLIVVIVAEAKGLSSQADEFFLFAGLMVADMLIFFWMTLKYEYLNTGNDSDNNSDELSLPDTQFEKHGHENNAFKSEENSKH